MKYIKTAIEKIEKELDSYMKNYPNTHRIIRHLLFDIEEHSKEIRNEARNEAITEFAERLKYEYGSDEIHGAIGKIADEMMKGV